MVHTFKEICTRTRANPNEAAPEAIMPQAACEALPRDAVQGLRPPYTPQTLRQWLQATHPQGSAIGATPGKGRARDREGHSGKGARKGPK